MRDVLKLLPAQLQPLRSTALWIWLPAAALLGVVVAAKLIYGIRTNEFLVDPIALMKAPAYTGLVSNVGILLWSAAASVCLFSYAMYDGHHRVRRFLLVSGLVTGVLGLDDFFLLHELVLPGLGIDQSLIVASYGVMILVYLWRFRDIIMQSQFLLLLIALGLLGTSAGIDQFLPRFKGMYLLEDGSKFLGIGTCSPTAAIAARRRSGTCFSRVPLRIPVGQ